jgi:Protein of unknown function (DUF3050)
LLRELAPTVPIADRVLALSEQVSAHQVFRSLDSVADVQTINEIAAGEEGDDGPGGVPESHFAIYLEAMREVGADIGPIARFLGEMDFGFS